MNQPSVWGIVSQMLAVFTMGHTVTMFFSKVTALMPWKFTEKVGKLIECAGLFALFSASSGIIWSFQDASRIIKQGPTRAVSQDKIDRTSNELNEFINSPGAVTTSLRTYFAFLGFASVSILLLYTAIFLARQARKYPKWRAWWLGASSFVALQLVIFFYAMMKPIAQIIFPGLDIQAHALRFGGSMFLLAAFVILVAFWTAPGRKVLSGPEAHGAE